MVAVDDGTRRAFHSGCCGSSVPLLLLGSHITGWKLYISLIVYPCPLLLVSVLDQFPITMSNLLLYLLLFCLRSYLWQIDVCNQFCLHRELKFRVSQTTTKPNKTSLKSFFNWSPSRFEVSMAFVWILLDSMHNNSSLTFSSAFVIWKCCHTFFWAS